MKEFITENMAWLLPTIGGVLAAMLANFKAVVAKVNKAVLEYEKISDADLLAQYNDNPESKNKQGYTEHQRANALRKRLVITEVKKTWLFCPTWLICIYIKSFCKLNKMPALKKEVDNVLDKGVEKLENAINTLAVPKEATVNTTLDVTISPTTNEVPISTPNTQGV
jgi:hypothetical protein